MPVSLLDKYLLFGIGWLGELLFCIIDHNVRLIFYHAHQQAIANVEKMGMSKGSEGALTFDSFSGKYFSVCKIFFNPLFIRFCQ